MTKKYETWTVLDTGKEIHYFKDEYHPEWLKAPDTTYIKFQELVEV